MSQLAGGTPVSLSVGEYEATFVSVGAAIASLKHQGRDLVVPYDPDELPDAYKGKTLIPWPNRVKDGKYTYGGENYELPINEHPTGAALHGLAAFTDWNLKATSNDSVTFETHIAPSYGYPFSLMASVTYTLNARYGLSATIRARNVGRDVAPYGVSSHPYLTCNLRPVDECQLTVPAGKVMEVDENLAPLRLSDVDQLDLDYRKARTIAGQEIDHAFTELPDGKWFVDLYDPTTGQSVRMTSNEPWVQVYSGTLIGRVGVAVEPMTCPPNAFNSQTDLISLKPGEETEYHFGILEVQP